MAERSVYIRVAVKNADQAVAELNKLGLRAETAIGRVERASKGASRELQSLDRSVAGGRRALDGLASSVILIDGPLGGVASRLTTLNAAISRFGVAGAGAAASFGALSYAWLATTRAAAEAEQRLFRVDAVLNATGFAAGVTARQIDDFARKLAEDTLTSRNAVREAAAVLLTFRSVAADSFFRALTAAQDLSAVFGQDLRGSVVQLGKALEDPVQGVTALRRVGVSFTAAQQALIRSLVEAGDKAEAQRVIFAELERQVGGAGAGEAAGLAGKLDTLTESWTNLKEALGDTRAAQNAVGLLSRALQTLESLIAETPGQAAERLRQTRAAINAAAGSGGLLSLTFGREIGPGKPESAAGQAAAAEIEGRLFAQARADAGRRAAERQRNADRLVEIEAKLNEELARLTANRIQATLAAERQAIAQLAALRTRDNAAQIDALIAKRKALSAGLIEQATAGERKRAEQSRAANQAIVDGLQAEVAALQLGERERMIDSVARRLNAEATEAQLAAVRRLAGRLYDEKQAIEAKAEAERAAQKLAAQGQRLSESLRTPLESYNAGLAEARRLLEAGAIGQETFNRRIAELEAGLRAAEPALQQLESLMGGAAAAGRNFFEGLLEGSRSFTDALQDLDRALLQVAQRVLLLEPLEALLRGEGVSGGLLGDLFGEGGFFGSLLGSPKAAGGPVLAGSLYPVNERGPEQSSAPGFFLPLRAGWITPAASREAAAPRAARPLQIVNNFAITTDDAAGFERARGVILADTAAATRRAVLRG